MHKSNKAATLIIPLVFLDILVLTLSYVLSYLFSPKITSLNINSFNLYEIGKFSWILIICIPLWFLVMLTLNMYNNTMFNYYDRIFKNILFTTLFLYLLVAILSNFIVDSMINKKLIQLFIFTNFFMSLIYRYLYVIMIKKHRYKMFKKVIVVGTPELFDKFKYYLDKTSIEINIIGYIGINGVKTTEKYNFIGVIEDLRSILTKNVVDEVIFDLPYGYVGDIKEYVYICEEKGVTANVIINSFKMKYARVRISDFGPLPMITYYTVNLNRIQLFLKRFMDIIGAVIGLSFTMIIGIFIAIAIKLDSKGPIIFSQKRVGLNGRIFNFYKFRSMYIDAEKRKAEFEASNQVCGGFMFKIKEDPRITNIGRFLRTTSLDELPQFLNVLMGDMSLVGSRPPTMDEVSKYDNRHWRRISIKPGITGFWQISGRSNISDFEEVVKLDTQYIDNWSVWRDIKVILKTLVVIFNRKGAY